MRAYPDSPSSAWRNRRRQRSETEATPGTRVNRIIQIDRGVIRQKKIVVAVDWKRQWSINISGDELDFCTVTPLLITDAGSCELAWATRICGKIWSVSPLVSMPKVNREGHLSGARALRVHIVHAVDTGHLLRDGSGD